MGFLFNLPAQNLAHVDHYPEPDGLPQQAQSAVDQNQAIRTHQYPLSGWTVDMFKMGGFAENTQPGSNCQQTRYRQQDPLSAGTHLLDYSLAGGLYRAADCHNGGCLLRWIRYVDTRFPKPLGFTPAFPAFLYKAGAVTN